MQVSIWITSQILVLILITTHSSMLDLVDKSKSCRNTSLYSSNGR